MKCYGTATPNGPTFSPMRATYTGGRLERAASHVRYWSSGCGSLLASDSESLHEDARSLEYQSCDPSVSLHVCCCRAKVGIGIIDDGKAAIAAPVIMPPGGELNIRTNAPETYTGVGGVGGTGIRRSSRLRLGVLARRSSRILRPSRLSCSL